MNRNNAVNDHRRSFWFSISHTYHHDLEAFYKAATGNEQSGRDIIDILPGRQCDKTNTSENIVSRSGAGWRRLAESRLSQLDDIALSHAACEEVKLPGASIVISLAKMCLTVAVKKK